MEIKLTYLTDDPQQQAICHDYWHHNGTRFVHSVKDVAHKHNVQYVGLAKRIAQWCQAYSPDDACFQCGESYCTYQSRTEFNTTASYRTDWTCSACRQRNQEEAQRQREAQKAQLRSHFEPYGRPLICFTPTPHNFLDSLELATALLSLIRLGATEDLTHIRPLVEIGEHRLSPTKQFDIELLQHLNDDGTLRPNIDHSPLHAFVFEDGQFTGTYYLLHVAWDFPAVLDSLTQHAIDDPAYLIQTFDHILLNMDWPEPWYEQWVPLWQKIALHECLQYLDLCMAGHSFHFEPGPRTHQVLANVLTTFSVAQAFNLIWAAARDAAAYYMRANIPKQRAANSVVGGIQRRADQARAENWDLKPFQRDRRCPQTMLSQVFFDTVLQIGDDGFFKPPSDH